MIALAFAAAIVSLTTLASIAAALRRVCYYGTFGTEFQPSLPGSPSGDFCFLGGSGERLACFKRHYGGVGPRVVSRARRVQGTAL